MSLLPKASVILCCFNQKIFVKDAIESVLSQTYANTELVVIDNGSTDGSTEVINEYRCNPRVKILLFPVNGPVTQRLNCGIKESSGDYVSILYADDYYLPTLIEKQMKVFERLPPDFGVVHSPYYRLNVLTGQKWVCPQGKFTGQVLEEMLTNYFNPGFMCPISPLVRKACFLKYPFREELFQEAEAIYLRIAISYRFQFLDEPLVVMRDHENNMGKALKKNYVCFLEILDKLVKEKDFPSTLRPRVTRLKSIASRCHGWYAIRQGEDLNWARERFWDSLRWWPTEGLHWKTAVGLLVSLAPETLRKKTNRLGNLLTRPKENLVVKQSWN